VSISCPPESGPSAPDLRTSNDRIVSWKRDVRVFHKGNYTQSKPIGQTSEHRNVIPKPRRLPLTHIRAIKSP
jgi:hypothetical protein